MESTQQKVYPLSRRRNSDIKLNYGTFCNNCWQTSSVQAQIVNMLGFAGYKVSVAAMQLSVVWTGVAVFNPTLFTKTSGGSWPKNWFAHLCSVPWQLFKSLSKMSKMPISWKKKKGRMTVLGFPGGSEVKASASNAGDSGLIPGLGRSPGEGNGKPLQYSCLENPMDREVW